MRDAAGMRWTPEATPLGGARYTYVPILLTVCAIAVVLDERPRWITLGWWHCVRVAALVALIIPVALDLRLPNDRSRGPTWSSEVSRATAECHGLSGQKVVKIDHPPDFGEFFVVVPCDRL
jgi:hypothetical protein